MGKQREGGAVGTAQSQSYTYGLHLPVWAVLVWLVWQDLNSGRLLSVATGLQGNGWIHLCLVGVFIAALFSSTPATVLQYHRYTGLDYVEDRIGYARSGGSDIASWAAFFTAVGVAVGFIGIPESWFGWARPIVMVVAALVLGWLTARLAAGIVFRALYEPTRSMATYAGGLTCQQLVLPGRRCPRRTFRESGYCRWHRILHEFRADLVCRPDAARTFMFQAGLLVAVLVALSWFAVVAGNVNLITVLLACLLLGSAVKLFGDAVLARDYPLAQFPIWSQLLAGGMALEVLAGAALAMTISRDVEAARAVFAGFTSQAWVQTYGPAALAVFAAGSAAMSLTLFVRRILFLHYRYFGPLAWLFALSLASGPVIALFRGSPAEMEAANTEFWQPIVGSKWWLFLAWVLAFNLCELVNILIRRRQLTEAGFRESVWPSYPICSGVPVAALFLVRYLMVWVDWSGAATYIGLVLLISGLFCAAATAVMVRWYPGWRGEGGVLGQVTLSPGVYQLVAPQDIECALAEHLNQMAASNVRQSYHQTVQGVEYLIITHNAPRTTEVVLTIECAGRPV